MHSAILAVAPLVVVLADTRPPALLALVPLAMMLAGARPPVLLACAPSALVLADARAPALLASAPLTLVLADAALLAPWRWCGTLFGFFFFAAPAPAAWASSRLPRLRVLLLLMRAASSGHSGPYCPLSRCDGAFCDGRVAMLPDYSPSPLASTIPARRAVPPIIKTRPICAIPIALCSPFISF